MPKPKLLIATSNPGKLAEFKQFLADVPITLVSLLDAGITQRAPEDGFTLQENAIAKATFYGGLANLPALADDGGFEIDALNGEPGVKSHRWVHQDREDEDEEIIAYAIKRMQGIPLEKRGAQLRLVLALVLLNGEVVTIEDKVQGVVPLVPAADRSEKLPYRSLLFFPKVEKFYAQLTPAEMEQYNHRKRAINKLKSVIMEKLL